MTFENSSPQIRPDRQTLYWSATWPKEVEALARQFLHNPYKAYFREFPNSLLDCLPLEHVMQEQSNEEYIQLVRLLPLIEAGLLDWSIDLNAKLVVAAIIYFNV